MANPMFVKNAKVHFKLIGPPPGTLTEFSCDVHEATVQSTPGDTVEYVTFCSKLTQAGLSSYLLHLVGVQDWSTGGFARFLWDNAGKTATVTVQGYGTVDATNPAVTGTVVLVEGSYGGEAETWAEIDVELPFTARPTIATTAPTLEEAPAGEQTTLEGAQAAA